MAIDPQERARMLRAYSIGPTMIRYLEEIGVERLSDLVGASAGDLAFRIDVALGRRHMNRLGVEALGNLIALAEAECGHSPAGPFTTMPPEGGI